MISEFEYTEIKINGRNRDENIDGSRELMDMLNQFTKEVEVIEEKHIITECDIKMIHKHEKEDDIFAADCSGNVLNQYRYSENTDTSLIISYHYNPELNKYEEEISEDENGKIPLGSLRINDPYNSLMQLLNFYNGKKMHKDVFVIIIAPICSLLVRYLNISRYMSIPDIIKKVFIEELYSSKLPRVKIITNAKDIYEIKLIGK